MSERQTSVHAEKKGRKECSACGAGLWLKDHTIGLFSGPWHFQDCPSVPGGAELSVQNIADKEAWDREPRVPREQGARILEAIKLLMASPSNEMMLARKAAILEEIEKLSVKESQGNE